MKTTPGSRGQRKKPTNQANRGERLNRAPASSFPLGSQLPVFFSGLSRWVSSLGFGRWTFNHIRDDFFFDNSRKKCLTWRFPAFTLLRNPFPMHCEWGEPGAIFPAHCPLERSAKEPLSKNRRLLDNHREDRHGEKEIIRLRSVRCIKSASERSSVLLSRFSHTAKVLSPDPNR
jgi:hypothetical protein